MTKCDKMQKEAHNSNEKNEQNNPKGYLSALFADYREKLLLFFKPLPTTINHKSMLAYIYI